MEGLEEALGIQLPRGNELETEETREFFDKLCAEKGVECSAPRSTARLIDKLVDLEFIFSRFYIRVNTG